MVSKATILRYYALSKPGIIRANVITGIAGYLFASQFNIDFVQLLGLAVGIIGVIASACVVNNIIDRDIDIAMKRTKDRALVTGNISIPDARAYAAVMGLLGVAILWLTQPFLVVILGIVAYVSYVGAYTYSKRVTVHSTFIGTLPGSLSLVAGYVAITDQIDTTAWLLFLLMTAWQMGHFFGIALYRQKDYKAANVPVMPVVYGDVATRLQSLGYIGLFVFIALALGLTESVSGLTSVVLMILGVWWLVAPIQKYKLKSDAWGKLVFLRSLLVMIALSVLLSIDSIWA